MIKWLATEKEKDSVVYEKGVEAFSEDPLATIAGLYNKKYERTYSVNRSNPIFQDENFYILDSEDAGVKRDAVYQASPSSSGYGSTSHSPDFANPGNQDDEHSNITRIYIDSNNVTEDGGIEKVADIVWHADEDAHDHKYVAKDQVEKVDKKTEIVRGRQRIKGFINPVFVKSIKVGKYSIQHDFNNKPHESEAMDSLVTSDVLLFTSYSDDGYANLDLKVRVDSIDPSDHETENMDKVIEQLTAAVMQSKGISTLKKAVARRERSQYAIGSVAGKLRRQMHKQKVDANNSSDDESDTSSIELKLEFSQEDFSSGTFPNYYEIMSPSSRIPEKTQPLYDEASSPEWFLARKKEKQTSFRDYKHKQQEDFISWGPRTQVFGNYSGDPRENFTLDKPQISIPRKKTKNNWTVIFLKSLCFLILLVIFLLVIVFISIFISQGKTMFGPM